jgi:hypothetical protein
MSEVELPKKRFELSMCLKDNKDGQSYYKGLLFETEDIDSEPSVIGCMEGMIRGLLIKLEEIK